MKLLNYTGKLNEKSEYIEVLKLLRKKCKYIEYVIVDKDDKKFIDQFKDQVTSLRVDKTWWGTKTSQKSEIYTITATKEIFVYLRQFETFCKYFNSHNGDYKERTDFGINDIAFFDDSKTPLLYTTTHEGYIFVREDLFK